MLDFSKIAELPHPQKLSPPWSWAGHIPFAMWLVQQCNPEMIVELGTHTGHSYFSFCQGALESGCNTRCYAVDSWKGDHQSGYYGEEVFNEVSLHNDRHYRHISTLLRMTFDEALNHFNDQTIDLLHIDGLHTYEAVKHDFTSWLPKLSSRGIILFHDIAVRHADFGVWKLWREISSSYPHISFDHSHGLGVLVTGSAPDKPVLELLKLWQNPVDQSLLKGLFASIGMGIELRTHMTLKDVSIMDRDTMIADRDTKISERDQQINSCNLVIADRDKKIIVSNLTIEKRDAAIAELNNQIAEKNTLLYEYEAQLKTIKSSRSWQITKPARKLLKSIRKRKKKLDPLFTANKRNEHDESRIDDEPNDYQLWISTFEPCDSEKLQFIKHEIETMLDPPLISIIMPVYNPSLEFLNEAIGSVRKQVYPHWELCIADDCSPDAKVRDRIKIHAEEDKRIKYLFRKQNGHISSASNSALKLATGDYIALLDHDDQLHPLALYWNAKEIISHPDAALLYSDEDKIDEQGIRREPYFKSDFNYDLFLCQNMISHLGVYKTALVRQLGGFREGMEGSQDYDLALRTLEHIQPYHIRHIPRVLYHWRIHEKSTAQSIEAKPYALTAATIAIQEHLGRTDVEATVTDAPNALVFNRINYTIPEPQPSVEIIILNLGNPDHTFHCVKTLLNKTTYENYTVTIVNAPSGNNKKNINSKEFAADTRIRIITSFISSNYSKLNNRAIAASSANYICLLQNNLEIITPEWLAEMISHAVQKGSGAIGAKIISQENTLVHGGIIMGIGGIAGYPHKHFPNNTTGYVGRGCLQQSFSALGGGCIVVERKKYLAGGGMNNSHLSTEPAQINLSLKLTELGLRNIWTPYAELLLHQTVDPAASKNLYMNKWTDQDIRYMQKTWKKFIQHDPAYNPNLSACREDFSHAWPPRICI